MYIKGLVDRLVFFFYMWFVLSVNRVNDLFNIVFWIDIGMEYFFFYWLFGVFKYLWVCKYRLDLM